MLPPNPSAGPPPRPTGCGCAGSPLAWTSSPTHLRVHSPLAPAYPQTPLCPQPPLYLTWKGWWAQLPGEATPPSLPPSRGLLCQQPGEGQTDTCSPALPASGLALTHLLHALPLQPGILASRPCPPSPRPCAWGVCESCVCLRCGSVVLLCLSHAVCSVCVHCVQGMCVCVSGVALRCLCVCV